MFAIYFLIPIILLVLCELLLKKDGFSVRELLRPRSLLTLLASEIFVYAALTVTFMSFTAFLSFDLITLLVAFAASVFFVLVKLLIRRSKEKFSFLTLFVLSLTIALFLEGFIFNMRFYQTQDYEPIDLSGKTQISSSLKLIEGSENEYKITSGSYTTIEILDIEQKINNIYFDITPKDAYGNAVNSTVILYVTDESNELYMTLPSQTVTGEVESSKYLYLVTNGVSEKLKISFTSTSAESFVFGGIYANAPRDFNFSIVRLLAVTLIVFLICILRPRSPVYKKKLSFSSRQSAVICAVIILQIILLLAITLLNPAFYGYPAAHTKQYQQLAEAFLDGRLYLEQEPSEFLKQMENPYDYNLRRQLASENNESYYWDAAYYDGHYYVYFGVLPVLLFYLPVRALTGADLSNLAVIQILLCLFVPSAFLLISKIVKKYFDPSRIPFAGFIALTLIFINTSGAVFIAKRPDFYSVPILLALVLTMLGIYFWLRSTDDPEKVSARHAVAGSLCMALVAACRPQFLLVSVLAFIIFWDAVIKKRTLFSKKSIGATVAICLPYILVAAALMWYNYARFGSPFDFGQNYNLTTNDMTGRGIRFERIGLALFTYFFQLPNITATFPFLTKVTISTNYLGTTITEAMFGGIFATIPLLWILALVPSLRRGLGKKKILPFVIALTSLSFFIGVFDAQGAGLLQRYMSDFAYLALLAAVFVVLFIYERSRGTRTLQINGFLSFSLFSSGAYCFLLIFGIYGTEIFYKNPTLFAKVSELVQFWR